MFLSIAFDCLLCRSFLRLITPSEAIARAARRESALVIFKPSGVKVTTPQIDSCGFESYSFQCKRCKSSLAGIIDPMNEELHVSLLEPTSWCEHSSPERADCQTEPLIGYVKEFILMILVSKRRLSPPHGEENEGVDLLR